MISTKTYKSIFILFFVFSCAFVFAQIPLSGTYDVQTSSSDGNTSTGVMQLTQSGETVRVRFTPANLGTLELIGLTQGSFLFLAFGQGSYGLIVYKINRGKLSGKWFDPNLGDQAGREELQGPESLNGTYVSSGYSPTGVTYSGSVSITPKGNLYQLVWTLQGSAYQGQGMICQSGQDRFLVAAWGSVENGLLGAYTISQTAQNQLQLSGKWAEIASATVGTEVMILSPQQTSSSELPSNPIKYPLPDPQPSSGKFTGDFYVASQMKNSLNLNNQLVSRLQIYYLLLTPEGQFYKGLPKGGLASFNFEQIQQNKPNFCGRYQSFGNQLRFQYSDRSEDYPFEKTENRLIIGKLRYEKANLCPSGLVLDGLYVNTNFTDTTIQALDSYGGVTSEQKISFSNKGTFSQENFVGYYGDTSRDGSYRTLYSGSNARSGSGDYQIRNGTITLTYSDGPPQTATFYYFPADFNGGQIKMVVIDGISFLRS